MEKQAKIGIGGALTGVFAASSVVDGAKKMKQEMKTPTPNEYDGVLKNPKLTPNASEGNVMPKTAWDIIDHLFQEKTAAGYRDYSEQVNKDLKSNDDKYIYRNYNDSGMDEKKKSVIPKVVAGTILAASVLSGISSGNPLRPFREMGSGLKNFAKDFPKLVLSKSRSGKVFFRGFRNAKDKVNSAERSTKFNKNVGNNSSNFLTGMGVGAGLGTGNLAVHLLGDKYFDNKRGVKKSYDAFQEPVSEIYHQKQRSRREPDKYVDNRRKDSHGYNRMNNYGSGRKSASQVIDELFEKNASGTFDNARHFFKTVVKEDVAQNSLKSLPYFLTPLAAGYAINKDLRYDAKPVRGKGSQDSDKIVIDVPLSHFKNKENLTKTAESYKSMPWKDFFKYEMPRANVRALTWAAPITALSAVTGRNLRSNGEKLQDKTKPIEEGNARITIETGNSRRRQNEIDPKMASESLESLYKEAIAVRVKKGDGTKKKRVLN